MSPSAKPPKRPRGRPAHADPPIRIDTNLPASLLRDLKILAQESGQPLSFHLTEALRPYLRRLRRKPPTQR